MQNRISSARLDKIVEELLDKHGSFSTEDPADQDRFHCLGYGLRAESIELSIYPDSRGLIFLRIGFPPKKSTSGSRGLADLTQALSGYSVPFCPPTGFHFNNSHVWIFLDPTDPRMIRIELRTKYRPQDVCGQEAIVISGISLSKESLRGVLEETM